MGLAFGVAYLGRIGAGPSKPLTAIGPVIDAASSLAVQAEARSGQLLCDPAAFRAGGIDTAGFELVPLPTESGEEGRVFATNHARLSAMAGS
jgi:adenylate cyclase